MTDNPKTRKVLAGLMLAIMLMGSLIGCQKEEPEVVELGTTHFTNVQAEDGTFTDDLTVTDDVDINGDCDVDGTLNVDAIDIDDALQLDSTLTVGIDGTSYDVTFYSDTAGDFFRYDQSEEALYITGTNAADAVLITDGDLDVADNIDLGTNIDVDGTANLDDIDVDGASNFADTATFAKGSGDAVDISSGGALNNDGTLDQNGTSDFGAAITCSYAGNCLTSGTTADIEWLGFASFGNATPDGVTDGTAEDVFIEGGLEVNGTIYADGAIDADSTLDVASSATVGSLSCTAAGTFGGGYGDTGATISTAGVGQFNGALTTDGAMTADSLVCTEGATFGGGYGSTGATISTAGVGQFNGALTVDGASTLTGDVTASADLSVDDTLNLDETAYTSTGAQNLTPTATFYELAPAATLTLTLQTGSAAAGDLLILASTVATSTVIVDTGCTVGGSTVSLGSDGDMAIFIYTGAAWCEIASPDNS